ncbi:hypothetical protein CBR_g12002 [Chara braunii]|uniref:Plasmid pRiA4b Orf3-like domain-containing protein n=1 Tax=Chara braunii TaxID=69332 RepID=A0A388KR62_CHABU|nr:hypothetical protein CBR_g12002 [Chara braunii]|eukprot:GBG72423.1 hypothetical protein CBR_g12002 [Chara braunii]
MNTEEKAVEGGEVVSAEAQKAIGEKTEAERNGDEQKEQGAVLSGGEGKQGEEEYVKVEAEEEEDKMIGKEKKDKEEKGKENSVKGGGGGGSEATPSSSSSDEAVEEDDDRLELAEDGDGDDEGEEEDDEDDDDYDELDGDEEEEEAAEEEEEDEEDGDAETEGVESGSSDDEEESEGELEEIVVLTCVLNQARGLHRGRKIWRRIAVPAEFSLLELHVALQNAFDWEDSHLHSFCQPRENPFPNVSTLPPNYGRTDSSSLLSLDLDSLEASQVRTYQLVVGTEDPYGEVLVPVEPSNKESSTVFIQYPFLEEAGGVSGATPIIVKAGIKQILEERAFRVGNILSEQQPILMYEYDFTESHEVTIAFGGKYLSTEGVHYPTCLAGAGASRAEDGNDMDEDGNLLPSYNYDEFAVTEVLATAYHLPCPLSIM